MPGHTPERSCVVCRAKAPAKALVRLTLDPAGLVVVDFRGKLGGRGAWCHPACLPTLEQQPGRLKRPLRAPVQAGPFVEQYRAALQRALEDGLSMAAAAGALVGGNAVLQQALRRSEVDEVLVAHDASERTLRQLHEAAPEGVTFTTVPWLTAASLGHRIGRGLRAAVGVKPSRAARHLRLQLRRLRGLG